MTTHKKNTALPEGHDGHDEKKKMEDRTWQLFPKKTWLTTALLVLLFLAGLGIRLFDLTDLPNDFYMVRQYRSLLMARGMYYQHLDSAPQWQRETAAAQVESPIEPPIMETLVALTSGASPLDSSESGR